MARAKLDTSEIEYLTHLVGSLPVNSQRGAIFDKLKAIRKEQDAVDYWITAQSVDTLRRLFYDFDRAQARFYCKICRQSLVNALRGHLRTNHLDDLELPDASDLATINADGSAAF